jgi:hypothetical protein
MITPSIESLMEHSLMNKIINHGKKSFEDYSIVDVFKIIGCLSVNNLGTINFWKKSLKLVTDALEDSNNYKGFVGHDQKRFVVYLFQIFKNKPFPV